MKSSDLDEMLGVPARLAIVATVASAPPVEGGGRWTFTALREETGLADGNLHVQARKLTDAGYLSRSRVQQGNRSVTCFDLTDSGRRALRGLAHRLQRVLGEGESPSGPKPARTRPARRSDDSRVW